MTWYVLHVVNSGDKHGAHWATGVFMLKKEEIQWPPLASDWILDLTVQFEYSTWPLVILNDKFISFHEKNKLESSISLHMGTVRGFFGKAL